MSILQPGVHRVKVKDVRLVPPNEGFTKPQLHVVFTDGGDGEITWFCPLGYTKEGFSLKKFEFDCDQFERMGWKAEENNFDFESLQDPMTSPLSNWEGDIEVENYNGKARFKWIAGGGGSMQREKMAAPEAAGFMASLRADLARAGKKVTQPARPAPRPAPAPKSPLGDPLPGEDPLPF